MRANTTVISVRQDDGGYLVQTDQDLWHARSVVLAAGRQHRRQGACAAGRRARRHHHAHPGGLPQPEPASRRRGPRRRRLGERDPDRRGTAPLRAARHARRRGARPNAADLSRQGHPVVDGRGGTVGRALRPDSRPGPGPQPAVDAAGRFTRADHRRPEFAESTRGAAGRTVGRHPRRDRAILRLVAEHVRVGRPQARTAARHHRRVGDRAGLDGGDPPQRFAADRRSRRRAVDPRPTLRRHPNDPVGHRVSSGSVVAGRRGVRPKGPSPPRRRRHRQPRPVPDGDAVSAPPQIDA